MNATYEYIIKNGSYTKIPHSLKYYDRFSNTYVYLLPEQFYMVHYILYKLSVNTEDQARFFVATDGMTLEQFVEYRATCDKKSESAKKRKTTCGHYQKNNENNPMYGKSHSDASKAKISKAISERNKGRHWFNDSKNNYILNDSEALKLNLSRGRV